MHDRTFSPGKVLLSGEHSAVYGHTALVMAITLGSVAQVVSEEVLQQHSQSVPLTEFGCRLVDIFAEYIGRTDVTDHLLFQTTLPVKAGLGSSASLASAGLKALAQKHQRRLEQDELFSLVLKSETFMHGKPSGADAAAVVYAGIQKFNKTENGIIRHELNQAVHNIPPFLLIKTGTPTEVTKEMVEYVAKRREDEPEYDGILQKMGMVTAQLIQSLEIGKKEDFFDIITENERLLESLGIVSDRAGEIITELKHMGAAVKLTGAGGRKTGSGMLIAFHQDIEYLKDHCKQKNFSVLETEVFDWSMV